jgi:Sec-independent protein translocase protein TatA
VAGIGRQINDRWPNLGRQLASLIGVSREKIDDIYSSAAQAISEQKEAFEDRLAEKKAQARDATRKPQQRDTLARPLRRMPRSIVKDGTLKSSMVPLPSKRTRSSTKRS